MSKTKDYLIDMMNSCDNTDHIGVVNNVQRVILNDEFDNDECYWCENCVKRDIDMIKHVKPLI
ncbi:MAG TPA: hypothetical protein PKN54_00785 [Candidatus Cloacimonas acidaminovorans]|nr:hypothetical protein [Candidatus Cloacimonas acidaminovorans]